MKDVWIFGDSLTAGYCGASYVSLLKQKMPDFRISSFGRDGDTLKGITARCLSHLRRKVPDLLILEAGANDIMHPFMERVGPQWQGFIEEMKASGSVAAPDSAAFFQGYESALKAIRQLYGGPLLLMTVPPVTEDKDHLLTARALDYNKELKRLTSSAGIPLFDLYGVLDSLIRGLVPAVSSEPFHFYRESPALFMNDVRLLGKGELTADELSRSRGLRLTIDGAHLNNTAAVAVARGLKNTILKIL